MREQQLNQRVGEIILKHAKQETISTLLAARYREEGMHPTVAKAIIENAKPGTIRALLVSRYHEDEIKRLSTKVESDSSISSKKER